MNSVEKCTWFQSKATQTLIGMFKSAGKEAFFVGGCVRNSLMGVPVTDLDMSTPMRPEDVMALAKSVGLKVIPTGLEHGTVTVVVAGEPFEITTFRRDVATDGRRAVVAFSYSLEDDARRRDFSMNALYADLDGKVLDPLGGLTDLQDRYVRFIGEPRDRIREDYLRILRLFRFHAVYGDPLAGLDPEALAACAQNLDGLAGLSKERVGSEIVKLMSASDPSTAIGAMEGSGVLQAILPGASGRMLYPYLSQEYAIDPMARLAALSGECAAKRLKLSKKQAARLALFQSLIGDARGLSEIAFVEGAEIALSVAALRAAAFEQPLQAGLRAEINAASEQVFPVRAQDLMPVYVGAELGAALKMLQRAWLDSGFALTKTELLNLLEAKSK
jgi:poly(A) polymerase